MKKFKIVKKFRTPEVDSSLRIAASGVHESSGWIGGEICQSKKAYQLLAMVAELPAEGPGDFIIPPFIVNYDRMLYCLVVHVFRLNMLCWTMVPACTSVIMN